MNRALNHAVLDQAVLSAFSLGLSLMLVAWSTPEAFGHFVLLFSLVLMLLTAQNALILMPLNVLLPGRAEAERTRIEASLGTLSGAFMVAGGLVGVLIWALYGDEPYLLPALVAYAALSLSREYWRSLYFVRGQAGRALLLDLTFVLVSAPAILALFFIVGPVTASIGGMAAGNLATLMAWTLRGRPAFATPRQAIADYRPIWQDASWALTGAMQTEAQMRGYVVIVEAWRGTATLGALQATRLIMSPLALVAGAWARVVRPRMVGAIHHERASEAFRMMLAGIGLVAAAALAYGLCVLLAWPLLDAWIFRGRYEAVETTVALWWVHAALMAVNTAVSTLLQAQRRFRQLTLLGLFTSVATIAGLLLIANADFPVLFILYVLIAMELLEAAGMLWLAMSRPRAEARLGLA